jgi:hypothetical protein
MKISLGARLYGARCGWSVANPELGEDGDRMRGFDVDLLTELTDDDAERIDCLAVVRSPDGLQHFAMHDGLVGVGGEVTQHVQHAPADCSWP